jgi:hypothetical protein
LNSLDNFKYEHADEENLIPQGWYKIFVYFTDKSGKNVELELDDVKIDLGETRDDLQKKAKSQASSAGLHNFGMDVYYKRFPNGHPVKFRLEHKETHQTFEFTQIYDGNGYPVK